MMRGKIKNTLRILKSYGNQKIFCIGRNKTGLTSLTKSLKTFGYVSSDQFKPKLLIEDWARRDFRRIINFCRTAQTFADQPFSLSFTYQALDSAYPGSKYILTIRDDPEQWYESTRRYMTKRYGDGQPPTIEDLRKATYIYTGWIAETYPLVHGVPEDDLFNKDILMKHYRLHNESVMEYFRNRPGDLLTINIANRDDWQRLCSFLKRESKLEQFPWENKT